MRGFNGKADKVKSGISTFLFFGSGIVMCKSDTHILR